MHLIFNPGRPSHPAARAVHGYSDGTLHHQDDFSDWAEDVHRFLGCADTIVAHNVAFDAPFVAREFRRAGLPQIRARQFCTMEASQAQLGKGKLDAALAEIGLRRSSQFHGALEDALLSMQLFLWLHGCPLSHLAVNLGAHVEPFNMRDVRENEDQAAEIGVNTGRSTASTTAEAQRIDILVEQVKHYKRVNDWGNAERLLMGEIARQEQDAAANNWGVAPWYYEQLAIVYSKQHMYGMELSILERYDRQPKAPGMGPIRLKERLNKSRAKLVRRAS
jgi:DNA polymerase III epsilon subunit-like protein